MIMDMVVYISTFIDDDTFQEMFSYIRNKHLQIRNKHINRIKSASLLTVRLTDPLGLDFPQEIPFALSHFTNQELYLEIANSLLGFYYNHYERSMYYYKETKICVDYVTYGSFYTDIKESDIYRLQRNKRVCAVYRLPLANKRYLLRHAPYAKALIY